MAEYLSNTASREIQTDKIITENSVVGIYNTCPRRWRTTQAKAKSRSGAPRCNFYTCREPEVENRCFIPTECFAMFANVAEALAENPDEVTRGYSEYTQKTIHIRDAEMGQTSR